MIDFQEEAGPIETTTVKVSRTAATIKGGRRFSFGALVVAGDRHGQVGIGYGKANEVPPAIEKGEKEARRDLKQVELQQGTIPHTVIGRFGAAKVKLVPASPGTGVVAGATVRAVLELAGLRDCLTKSYGSSNQINLVKATLNGLTQLRSKKRTEELRGTDIEDTHVEEILKRGAAYMPPVKVKPIVEEEPTTGKKVGKPSGKRGEKKRSRRAPAAAKAETEKKEEKPAAESTPEQPVAAAVAEPPATEPTTTTETPAPADEPKEN